MTVVIIVVRSSATVNRAAEAIRMLAEARGGNMLHARVARVRVAAHRLRRHRYAGSAPDGHGKVETTKNTYGHLFAQDRASILTATNQAVSRLYAIADPSVRFCAAGPDYYTRLNAGRQTRNRIREPERLNPGMKLTLTPATQAA